MNVPKFKYSINASLLPLYASLDQALHYHFPLLNLFWLLNSTNQLCDVGHITSPQFLIHEMRELVSLCWFSSHTSARLLAGLHVTPRVSHDLCQVGPGRGWAMTFSPLWADARCLGTSGVLPGSSPALISAPDKVSSNAVSVLLDALFIPHSLPFWGKT